MGLMIFRILPKLLLLLSLFSCDNSKDNTSQREVYGEPSYVFQMGTEVLGDRISRDEKIYGVVIDSSGNIYTSGYTEGDLAESNGGDKDIVISKFSSSGSHTWTVHLGDDSFPGVLTSDDRGHSLVLDSNENIIFSAYTYGSPVETNSDDGNSYDILIGKLSPQGQFIWLKQWGEESFGSFASGSDIARKIIIDDQDNIYFTGETNGNLFETNAGNVDFYLAKLDSGGSRQWGTQVGTTTITNYGGSATGVDRTLAIFRDSSGNLYTIGATLSSLGETSGGSYDIFIAKFNSSGSLQWIKQLGDTTMGSAADGYDRPRAAAVDSNMNFYIAAYTNSSFGEEYGGGDYDSMLIKLNSSGDLQWVKQLGNVTIGARANGEDVPSDVIIADDGYIYMSGYTTGSFGETNGGERDTYMAKFDSSGNLLSLNQFGYETFGSKSAGDDEPHDMEKDQYGYIYLTGSSTSDINGTAQEHDMFIFKFNPDGSRSF